MAALFLKIANFFRGIYWKVFKPRGIGVRILVINGEKILLVKHHYCKIFYLPGGGVKKKETAIGAARRELLEECGLPLNNFDFLGRYLNDYEGKKDEIFLFLAKTEGDESKRGIEIKSCSYFFLNSLPVDVSPGTARRIQEYKIGKFEGGSLVIF